MYGGGPAPIVLLGAEDFLGVESHLPSNLLPRVSGHAPHDCEQSALGHVFSLVDWLTGSNASEKFVMLGLVDIVAFSTINPQVLDLEKLDTTYGNNGLRNLRLQRQATINRKSLSNTTRGMGRILCAHPLHRQEES